MSATTFTDGVTLIVAAWLNDVDSVTYDNFGDGSSYTGNLTIGASKVTVAAASGNTAIAGTLSQLGAVSGTAYSVSVPTATATTLFAVTSVLTGGGAVLVVGKNTETNGVGAFIGAVTADKNGGYTVALITNTAGVGIALSMSGANVQLTHTHGSTKTYAGSAIAMQ